MREIRFSAGEPADGPVRNSWAGWPSAAGVRPYLVLRVSVEGTPDPRTGYLCNIRLIDDLLRRRTIPLVNRLMVNGPQPQSGEALVRAIADDLAPHAPPGTRWAGCELHLTPFLKYEAGDNLMVQVTQSFEFAAAHRLHCPELSDRENRDVFGKCNNPNGHGHNYVLEVTLAGMPDAQTGVLVPIDRLEETVKRRVIDRFDHKHLNQDCDEFRALNPSVEHIARVIWSLLDGQFAPARLARVRVWETAKTYAEYDGR